MDPRLEYELLLSRRQFFGNSGIRLGGVALAGLLGSQAGFLSGSARAEQQAANQKMHRALEGLPHFAPKPNRSSICT